MNKEAIELIKKMVKDGNLPQEIAVKYCPEIEKEDEKIRRVISDILLIDSDGIKEILDTNNVLIQDVDAWLEKKGKQEWTEEDKPYFKKISLILSKELPADEFHDVMAWFEHLKGTDEEPDILKGVTLDNNKGGIKDEMIRKAVISTFKPHCNFYEVSVDEVLAWFEKRFSKSRQKDIDDAYLKGVCDAKRELEKQDEQKPIVDKIEPKFNVGDWVVTNLNNVVLIKAIEGSEYVLENRMRFSVDFVDRCWRKYTIQDAKDGDVLATLDYILIFKKLLSKDGGVSYCHYDFGCSTPHFNFNEDDNWYFGKEAKVYPATKEQRDTLMKAMTDAGYTFDFEKKELKKIEQKPVNIVTILDDYFANTPKEQQDKDWEELKHLNNFGWELVEQKTGWSKEDERQYRAAIAICNSLGHTDIADWLKSHRPQKNNWERVTKEIYFKEPVLIQRKDKSDSWEGYRVCNDYTLDPQTDECYIRIKDINNQKHWKPNQAEIDFLNMIAGCMNKTLNEPEKAELKRIIEKIKGL